MKVSEKNYQLNYLLNNGNCLVKYYNTIKGAKDFLSKNLDNILFFDLIDLDTLESINLSDCFEGVFYNE